MTAPLVPNDTCDVHALAETIENVAKCTGMSSVMVLRMMNSTQESGRHKRREFDDDIPF